MFQRIHFFAIGCLLSAAMEVVHAQGVSVGPAGVKLQDFGEVDVQTTIAHWARAEQSQITTYLNLQIDLLKQACQLTDAQTEKLRLLTKGVALRRIQSGEKQLKKFMIDSELIPNDEATPNAEIIPADKLLVSGARKDDTVQGLVLFRTRFSQPLFDGPLWQGVLKPTSPRRNFKITLRIAWIETESFLRQHSQAQLHRLTECSVCPTLSGAISRTFGLQSSPQK